MNGKLGGGEGVGGVVVGGGLVVGGGVVVGHSMHCNQNIVFSSFLYRFSRS